jgi:thiosulfate dehydrogenase
MNTHEFFRRLALPGAALAAIAPGVIVLAVLTVKPVSARAPFTPEELADQQNELLKVVDHGRDLWHGSLKSMSTNGLACGNCHPDAAASNPQTFPKYQSDLGRVAALRDMINWCITGPLAGKPLDPDSADMVAMEAYATYLYRGTTITPGLATAQTSPIVVIKSGTGYPRKGSGIGYDK